MNKKLFDVAHPWMLIVAGLVFIALGVVLAPALGTSGHRTVIDPFTQFAPSSLIVLVMGDVGSGSSSKERWLFSGAADDD